MNELPGIEQGSFKVDWVKLNNELFGRITGNAQLRARYEAADSTGAQQICSDTFDDLVKDAEDFVNRFVILLR